MPNIKFSNGVCTSRDPGSLGEGQMVSAIGGFYKPGDTERIHKILGESRLAKPGSETCINGLQFCAFDSGGTDAIVALAGTTLYKAATSGASFSSLVTGLNASGTKLAAAHAYNKWYLGNGYDRNRVLKSDGTVRMHGMIAPTQPPVCSALLQASHDLKRPTAAYTGTGDTGWLNTGYAWDADVNTFSYKTMNAVIGATQRSYWYGFGSSTSANRRLVVKWSVEAAQWTPGGRRQTIYGGKATIKIEYATTYAGTPPGNDSLLTGLTYTTMIEEVSVQDNTGIIETSVPISVNSNAVAVRATFTYVSGTTTLTGKIFDIRITNSNPNAFTPTTGLYYAFTEYDSVNKLESAASPASPLVTAASTINYVSISVPGAANQLNSNATHYRIYRTTDGGSQPTGLGLLTEIPIEAGSGDPLVFTLFDDFSLFNKDTQPVPLYALLVVSDEQGSIPVPRDGQPPTFSHMSFFKGSLVGISPQQPQSLYYSYGGRPDSFPSLYVVNTFPVPEHETLVAAVPCGDTLIVAGKEMMFAMDDLPRAFEGVIQQADPRPLRGQPGCINSYSIVSYSVSGESRVAWVSPFGLHETNGTTSRKISLDIDWYGTPGYFGTSVPGTPNVCLSWDAKYQMLVLSYCSDTSITDQFNDNFWLIHMAPEHQLPNGQPKWTGPHPGPIQCMTSGYVSGDYRRYSGAIDGYVLREFYGTVDSSGAALTMSLTSPWIYGPYREFGIYKANLYHSVWTGNLGLTWSCKRDSTPSVVKTKSNTLSSLTAEGGTEFFVGRQGEAFKVVVAHSTASTGSIRDIRFDVLSGGTPGRTS